MTREEAIKWMQEEKASFERAPDLNGCPMTEYWQKAIDVYDMAISALRQQDVTDTNVRKMTNAQKIRAMSDKELCNWLFQRDCKNIAAFLQRGGAGVMNAAQLLDWLQQPAEEADHA